MNIPQHAGPHDDERIQHKPPHNARDHYRAAYCEIPDLAPPPGTVRIVRNRYRAWLKRRGLRDAPWDRFAFGAAETQQEAR